MKTHPAEVHPDDDDVACKVEGEQRELARKRDGEIARGGESCADPEAESEGNGVRASVEARMASTWNNCKNSSQRKAMATEAACANTRGTAPRRRRNTA